MITIKWTNVKKDVDKQTYRLANVHIDNARQSIVDSAQQDDTKSSVNLILRFCDEGVSLVNTAIKHALSVYPSQTLTDDLENVEGLQWQYSFSDAVDEGSICKLIHKYIVDYILWKWCDIYVPSLANSYKSALAVVESKLQEACFRIDWNVKQRRETFEVTDDDVTVEFVDIEEEEEEDITTEFD